MPGPRRARAGGAALDLSPGQHRTQHPCGPVFPSEVWTFPAFSLLTHCAKWCTMVLPFTPLPFIMKKPPPVRLSVCLPPDVHAALAAYADVSGTSINRSIAEWLTTSLEAIQFTTQQVHKAKEAPRLAAARVHAYAAAMSQLAVGQKPPVL